MSQPTTTPPNGIDPTTIDAHVAGTSDARQGFDFSMIIQLFQALFERFMGNSEDRDNPQDITPPATAPDGQPLPVATLTRADLSNTTFTGLSSEEEIAANQILGMIGDGRVNDGERAQIDSILDAHPRLATLQVDSNIPMFNHPAMSIEQFIALEKPWLAGGGRVVNDADQRAAIGVMLADARADLVQPDAPASPTLVADTSPSTGATFQPAVLRDTPSFLESYFNQLESRIPEGGTAVVGGITQSMNVLSDTRFTEAQLSTAERNITAAFDTDGVAGLSSRELQTMENYVEAHNIDSAGDLLGHFSAPTFNIQAARGADAGVSV